MRALALVLLMLVSPALFAATATITWQNPTQNVDSSAIPATGAGSVAATRIEWGTCSGTAFGTVEGQHVLTGNGTSYTVPGLTAGRTYCFRAFARNTFAEESAASNVVTRAIPAPVPRPPVLATVVTVAYSVQRVKGELVALPVGSVAVGTPCNPAKSTRVEGMVLHGINPTDVKLYTGAVPRNLHSYCAAV